MKRLLYLIIYTGALTLLCTGKSMASSLDTDSIATWAKQFEGWTEERFRQYADSVYSSIYAPVIACKADSATFGKIEAKQEQEEQERIKREQAERIRREQEELRRKEEHSKLPETPIIEEPKVEQHVLEAPVQTPMFEPKEDIQITEKEPKKEIEHEITEDEFFDDFFSDDDDE